MNAQLNSIVVQQRVAGLRRAAERTRLARDAGAPRRSWRDSNPIIRTSARLARLSGRLAPSGPRAAKDRPLTPPPTTPSPS
jgi:hypothetical protein